MNREIKYKIWNTSVKHMTKPISIQDIAIFRPPTNMTNENCIYLEFSGRYDKLDKEIYEGDTYVLKDEYNILGTNISFNRETKFVIVFDEGSFSSKVINAKNTAQNYEGIGVYKIGEIYHLHRTTQIEVTGNIYEI